MEFFPLFIYLYQGSPKQLQAMIAAMQLKAINYTLAFTLIPLFTAILLLWTEALGNSMEGT